MLLPKPTLKILVLGLRNIALHSDKRDPTDFYQLDQRRWDFVALNNHLGDPAKFPPTEPYHRRLRFTDIGQYLKIQLPAVAMEHLFIQAGALELRDTPMKARFFSPSVESDEYLMLIVDTGGINLSEKYNGVLDNYLESGQEVCICLTKSPPLPKGNSKWRKHDKPAWPARFATAPSSFRAATPVGSLCVVVKQFGKKLPIPRDHVGTYAGYDNLLPSHQVFLKLEDTSKVSRREFNGMARLQHTPFDKSWFDDGDSEAGMDIVIQGQDEANESPTRETLRSILCGTSIHGYFEVSLLEGIDTRTLDCIMSNIHPDRRAGRAEFMARLPCGFGLVTGAPGCAKSCQLAVMITLCVAKGDSVLLIASRHEAVDSCLRKVVEIIKLTDMQPLVLRSYDASEDMKACRRVLWCDGADWKKTSFRVRSRWRPELSVAFWLSFYLGRELSPWTGRHLDARDTPPAIAALRQSIQQYNDTPKVIAITEMERLWRIIDTNLKRGVEFIYSMASVVATTPFGALTSTTKSFTQKAAVLAVDEAAAIDEAQVLQCVFRQSVILLAFDVRQLPAFSASKTSSLVPRVNTYEGQYCMSLAHRLLLLSWPVIMMDQQFRMLPGLFEPARQVFYRSSNIVDVPLLQQDTSVAVKVESWARPFGVTTPPDNKFWPVFLNIRGTKCRKQPFSKSSMNTGMWDSFFPVMWQYFLDDRSQYHVAWDRVCIITPYRAMTAYIQDFLQEQGIEIDVGYDENSAHEHRVSMEEAEQEQDPAGPMVRRHNPMAMDTATIDSYQGQEKDLVIAFTTVSASSGAKFVANPNRLCVGFTRMRQALIVVGDLATANPFGKNTTMTEDGQYLRVGEFNQLWGWFPRNGRVVERSSVPT